MNHWSVEDIDGQEGKIVIVTGGNDGIGFETAKALAGLGSRVIIAADDQSKGQKAIEKIIEAHSDADVEYEHLDLGSFRSITAFVDRIMQEYGIVDTLINNAGIAGVVDRMESADGHELTFAVNYLGHFSLTAQLFPLLLRSQEPRVVFVSSIEHKTGTIDFSDIEIRNHYSADRAYAQSKLAMLMFARELHRRCEEGDLNVRSIPVHPGIASTHIFDKGPALSGKKYHIPQLIERMLVKRFGQSPEDGALPLLFAACSIEARSGVYYGPSGFNEYWGAPMEAKVSVRAENLLAMEKLWSESEKLTGIRFDVKEARTIGVH